MKANRPDRLLAIALGSFVAPDQTLPIDRKEEWRCPTQSRPNRAAS
jgi:hypothetical protein